ncbi:hypothetical protein FQR65_LT08663 [Abscondita terminalis]|nr:hypothetical protein FQR65_LT08663 [Abscondita terminalis]
MMMLISSIIFLGLFFLPIHSALPRPSESSALLKYKLKITTALTDVLNFIYTHHDEMNFDVSVALIITKAQLDATLTYDLSEEDLKTVEKLIKLCDAGIDGVLKNFSNGSSLYHLYKKFLTNKLQNLEPIKQQFVDNIFKNKIAQYHGISSNECLYELFRQTPRDFKSYHCSIGDRCKEFMFGRRIDSGYVLTHRLLFLHIMRMMRCPISSLFINQLTNTYCSLILREAKTNELLGFPQQDIFIEQVVFCGLEGFNEFLNTKWIKYIINWKTKNGCYKDVHSFNTRSASIISYGCMDHTTGLASAALSTSLRYVVHKLHPE